MKILEFFIIINMKTMVNYCIQQNDSEWNFGVTLYFIVFFCIIFSCIKSLKLLPLLWNINNKIYIFLQIAQNLKTKHFYHDNMVIKYVL